ncbi:hypothetical protein ACFL2U_00090 [Patescibacteria group bacterium]
MEQENNNKQEKNEPQEVVHVEAQPIEEPQQAAPSRVDNVKIDKIGNLTLNLVADPLKKRYDKHYKENKMHLITDIILIAIIVILLGVILNLWFFSRSRLINLIDFQVHSNPEHLINGHQTEFTISYTNTTQNSLTDVNLVLRVPKSLHQPQYSLEDFELKTNTLKINELAPKAHGEFKVSGLLLGNMNAKHEFIAVINYKNKYGQDRQEFFSQHFQLADSVVKTQVNLPAKVIATSPFETKISLENTSDINFTNARLAMAWPQGYVLNSTDAGELNEDNLWPIESITPGQTASYIFTGKSYIDDPQNINITANVFVDYNNQEFLIARISNAVWVDFSKFRVSLTNLENNHAVSPGGQTTFTVLYKNEEDYAVNNVEIGLNLSGEFAAVSQIRVNQNDYKKLSTIEPGQEGTIELKAKTKSTIHYNEFKENGFVINTRGFASYDDPIETSRISVESKPITTLINSRLSLKTTGVFYTQHGDQIGVGSVPPIVGEYTSYWVIIKIENTNNSIKDLIISAQIPNGVEFTNTYNVTEGNQIVFDENSRKLSWKLQNVPSFSGIFNPAPEARIQLAIIPGANQVGSSPALLTNITATATDQKTNAFITATGNNITTAIFSDDFLNKVIE